MKSKQNTSSTSTKQPLENPNVIALCVQQHSPELSTTDIHQNDQFLIIFANQKILCYFNSIDHNLVVQSNLTSFEFWRCLFIFKYLDNNTNKICLIHYESNMYLSAQPEDAECKNQIVSVCLTRKFNKFCQFELQHFNSDSFHVIPNKVNVSYDKPIKIKNISLQKYLQISRKHQIPHLSNEQQQQQNILLKSYKKRHLHIDHLWITNQYSNYLQNGDLVLILNKQQTTYIALQPKNQLFMKSKQGTLQSNKKFMQPENYQLVEKLISQINNANYVYCLWQVSSKQQINPSNNNLIHNRDVIMFKHCFTKVELYKNWLGTNVYPNNIFELGKEGDQGLNTQNCGFYVKNTITYCFDNNKIADNFRPNQPLYLHNTLILDHRFQLQFQKVNTQQIRFLRLFTQSLIQFAQVILNFLYQSKQLQPIATVSESTFDKLGNKNVQQKNITKSHFPNQPQPLQIFSVDYERVKVMINAYNELYEILVANKTNNTIYTNNFVIKITLMILQSIASQTKDIITTQNRSKPIIQPLINSCYYFLINILEKQHIILKSSVLHCLKQLTKIDAPSSIYLMYYLSRVWGPNHIIDLLLQLSTSIDEQNQTLLFYCITEIIEHCQDWKKDTNKIRQILDSMGFLTRYIKGKGVVLETKDNTEPISVFNFKEADLKTLQLFKIAVLSNAFCSDDFKNSLQHEQILMSLLRRKDICYQRKPAIFQTEEELQKYQLYTKTSQRQNRPIYKAALIDFIHFYLMKLCSSTISTFRNRKFIFFDISQFQQFCITQNETSSKISQQYLQSQQNFQYSSKKMIKQLLTTSKQTNFSFPIQKSKKIKQQSNIYWLLNYDKPSYSIIQIICHLDTLIQNLDIWDSLFLSLYDTPKQQQQNQGTQINQTSDTHCAAPHSKNSKIRNNHLCLMLGGYDTLMKVVDILISEGYISLKTLCQLERRILDLCFFLISLTNNTNKLYSQDSRFFHIYQNTMNEFKQFYKERQLKGGLLVQQIMVQQKLRKLYHNTNKCLSTILMVKTRLVVHPGIETISRNCFFNFNQFINKYLKLYAHICTVTNKQNNKAHTLLDLSIIVKLLNFHEQKNAHQKNQITIISLPHPTERTQTISNISLVDEGQVEERNNRIHKNLSDEQFPNQVYAKKYELSKIEPFSQISGSQNFERDYITSFRCCEQIVCKIKLFTETKQNILKNDYMQINVEALLSKYLLKINEEVAQLNKNQNHQIKNCVIRAYGLPEMLAQLIFCSNLLDETLLINSINFLHQHPPSLAKLAQLHQHINYTPTYLKIFITCLKEHLRNTIELVADKHQLRDQLKQVVSFITKLIQTCKPILQQHQFILILGFICEIFPNKTLSQKIYHILLSMHNKSNRKCKGSLSCKRELQKFIFNTKVKSQVEIGKPTQQIEIEEEDNRLNSGNILKALKTLQTFKEFLAENQQNSSPKALQNSIQYITQLNRYISLIFKLCENSEQVNHHFIENITNIDSLQAIAFDTEIPNKFKIPLCIYFTNDFKNTYDNIVIYDYFQWIAQTLREHTLYVDQLPQYIEQNDRSLSQHHCIFPTSSIRQKEHKISMVFETKQRQQTFFSNNGMTKKPLPTQYYYWQLLYSRPFMYREEGVLILLEEMISNITTLPTMSQENQQYSIGRSVIQIYDCLKSIMQKIQKQSPILSKKSNHEKLENLQCSISISFIRKIKKNLILMEQKTQRLKINIFNTTFVNQSIASNIVHLLMKFNLLKKFIKMFYYKETNASFGKSVNIEKKQKELSQDSDDINHENCKHSRSSKMSNRRSSKDSFEVGMLNVFKKTQNLISLKQLLPHEERIKDDQPLFQFNTRLRKNLHHTSQLNLANQNNIFNDRRFLISEISLILENICQLVFNPYIAQKLLQLFINFCQQGGTTKILSNKIMNALESERHTYLKCNGNQNYKIKLKHDVFLEIRPQHLVNEKSFDVEINYTNYCLPLQNLMIVVHDLIKRDQINIVITMLTSVSTEINQCSLKQDMQHIFNSPKLNLSNTLQILQNLSDILQSISLKQQTNYSILIKYLPVIKSLLLTFVPIKLCQSTINQNVLRVEKKIQIIISQYVNKVLINIRKNYQKKYQQRGNTNFRNNSNTRRKKQTFIAHFNQKYINSDFTNIKLHEKPSHLINKKTKSKKSPPNQLLSDYIPQVQIDLYRMIELYAILQSRMTFTQKQFYQLVSNKLIKMVYGMTLQSSLKLIFKAQLMKCTTNIENKPSDIITHNMELQKFIQYKIRKLCNTKQLLSTNMMVMESLSLIATFYDYLCFLLFHHHSSLFFANNPKSSPLNSKYKQKQLSAPIFRRELWQCISMFQQKIAQLFLFSLKKKGVLIHGNKFFLRSKQKTLEQMGVHHNDKKLYCLLHRILSQSINIFNFRMTIQTKLLEMNHINNSDSDRRQKPKKEIPIWTFPKFIQMRTELFTQLRDSKQQIDLYTELYNCITTMIANVNSTQYLFSYLNDKICCRYVFKQNPTNYHIFFLYQAFGKDMNIFVMNQLKKVSNIQQNTDIGKSVNSNNTKIEDQSQTIIQTQQLMSQICNYTIFTSPKNSSVLMYMGHRIVSQFLLIASIILITICNINTCLLYSEKDNTYYTNNLVKINKYILSSNLFILLFLTSNKIAIFWKLAISLIFLSQCKINRGLQISQFKPAKIKILKYISSANITMLLAMLTLLIFHILIMFNNKMVPMLYFVVIFISDDIPNNFIRKLKIFTHSTWGNISLMCTVVWLQYYFNPFLITLLPDIKSTPVYDIFLTQLIKLLSTKINNLQPNQLLNVITNFLMLGLFLLGVASLLAHFRSNIQAEQEKEESSEEKCLICGNLADNHHIKYKHNIDKLIKFQIHMKIRNQHSFTFMDILLANYLLPK